MSKMISGKLGILSVAASSALTGCGPAQSPLKVHSLSTKHDLAIARAAQGASTVIKDPSRAATLFKESLQYEPDNRDSKLGLAHALDLSGHTDDAVKIWTELAKGDDKVAHTAAKFLDKHAKSSGK
ncbi:MAG TPA: tetratricopeptide repeat protein [Chthonomonadaceae bacterium]|nr:tetratricopeptide repeat protein [Chthonomonadaceae bacterium]